MFFTILMHAASFWRFAKIFRFYYFKFRPPLLELVEDTATDVDDKILKMFDKIFRYKGE